MYYGIKSDYGNVAYVDSQAITAADVLELAPSWSNTATEIYGTGLCSVKTYLTGTLHVVSHTDFSGVEGLASIAPYNGENIYIIAVTNGTDPTSSNYMTALWIAAASASAAVTRYLNGEWNNVDNLLFAGTLEQAEQEGAVEDLLDWDDTPSEDPDDPDGTLPQGGEFADRGLFEQTDIMSLYDLPNPEDDMNMDYGGFLRTYVLDQSTLTAVGSALFAPDFWTGLKQKFEGLSDPLQMIVNCIQLPLWNIGGSSGTMRIGGIEVKDDEDHSITVQFTSSRYIRASMGSVTLKEIWGSEKDYNAASISIFLPYVGVKELDPDIVVGSTMTLTCYIDIWTGDIVYLMHVSNADAKKKYFTAQSVPYRWTGNCAKTVPIGRVDNTNKLITMAGTIAGLGAGAMLGGIGAAGVIGGMMAGGAGAIGASSTALGAGLGTMKAGGAIAAVTAAKALHSGFNPTVHSSSGVSGASGQMDYQYAYIMVKRGVPKYPNNWREQIGAPNYQTFQGVSMSGYTLFSEIHLTGMADASEAERAELERQLTEEGVIL